MSCSKKSSSFSLTKQVYLKKDNLKGSFLLLIITLVLGIGFIYFQYDGFNYLKSVGLFFTGPNSTVSTSFIIGITFMHVLHLVAGLIVLLVVIYNHFKSKYNATEMLGFELGAIFWHFVGVLWIYLFFFFYFYLLGTFLLIILLIFFIEFSLLYVFSVIFEKIQN